MPYFLRFYSEEDDEEEIGTEDESESDQEEDIEN